MVWQGKNWKGDVTRGKRSSTKTNQANFSRRCAKFLEYNNYWLAFKEATQQLFDMQSGCNSGKKGFGVISICNKYNKKYGLDGIIIRQLKPQTIRDAMNAMRAGKSPVKMGRPEKIPPKFTTALAIHSTMKQVGATDGEASAENMIPLMKAMTDGTTWEGQFSLEYAWRKTCRDHPEHFVPAKIKNHENRRAEWPTAQNINDWMDAYFFIIIIHGFNECHIR